MKIRVAAIALLLLLPAALFAMEAPERATDTDTRFPTISRFQDRAPVSAEKRAARVAELNHGDCGYNPSLPYNCRYVCYNGVPQHYPSGEPLVLCWSEPIEPGDQGCNGGNECDSSVTCWSAPIYQGCNLDGTFCANCQP